VAGPALPQMKKGRVSPTRPICLYGKAICPNYAAASTGSVHNKTFR
jgi:hypothetical protein